MRALWLLVLALLLCAAPPRVGAADGDDDGNPHRMRGPDDEENCESCHEEDMSLSQSPLDTCLACHELTEHAGAAEHVRASAADVTRVRATPLRSDDGDPLLPLTEEGTIWCGTCHLYHDPRVNEEPLLTEQWLPPTTGMAGAVAAAIAGQWGNLAGKYGQPLPVASLAEHGSAWLRLPVSNGRLCTACHTYAGGATK